MSRQFNKFVDNYHPDCEEPEEPVKLDRPMRSWHHYLTGHHPEVKYTKHIASLGSTRMLGAGLVLCFDADCVCIGHTFAWSDFTAADDCEVVDEVAVKITLRRWEEVKRD